MIVLHTPPNLDTVKSELVQYHDSGTYMDQITLVDKQAENYLSERVEQNNRLSQPKKLAVVFDIDETTLSNYSHLLNRNFGRAKDTFIKDQQKAQDPAIQPTLALFKLAEKDHVAVFFITGRHEDLRPATVKNLDAAGYFAFNGLYFRPDNDKNSSVVAYKSSTRKQIENKGFDVVLNIGDQESDLAGGAADKDFKLPNPFYYVG
ncbi:MAG TPA: HAD family acid phosphatase [Gammaproteobacteria bacterium]|nr:HAD family acid phosphatase [Gammaproteobacteria bacterium]